eukprot:544601_1
MADGNNIERPPTSNETLCGISKVSFNTELHALFTHCESKHRLNLDKLCGNELCVSCDKYYKKREMYLECIRTELECLEPLKYELLAFLMHSSTKYHTSDDASKAVQLKLDAWTAWTLRDHMKRGIHIRTIKRVMKGMDIGAFMDLLVQFQPWMDVDSLMNIMESQPGMNGEECSACHIPYHECQRTMSLCWMCHMAVKAMLLVYFTTNLHDTKEQYFKKINRYISRHCVKYQCAWFWSIRNFMYGSYRDCRHFYILMFGKHPVPNHVVNQMREETEGDLLQPPIITKQQLVSVQQDMMKTLLKSFNGETAHVFGSHPINGVSLVDEAGRNVYTYRSVI